MIQAASTNRLPPEITTLRGRVSPDGQGVEFVSADAIVCGTVPVEVVNEYDAPLATMLFLVESDEHDILKLRVRILDRSRFRPPAEDDDD